MIHYKQWLFTLTFLMFMIASYSINVAKAAEGMAAFPDLTPLILTNEDVTLYYDPQKSIILNGKHPESQSYYEAGVYISRPLRTQLLGPGKGFFTIDCDSGGSWDPGCTVLEEIAGQLKPVVDIRGLRFVLPGDGNIYVDGHNNTMFNVRRKFEWQDGTFVEVQQPFYYVGVETHTRTDLEMYSTTDYKQVVAILPKGTPVHVLLNEKHNYLVKTAFGLLGWINIQNVSQENSPIEGIYFAGD